MGKRGVHTIPDELVEAEGKELLCVPHSDSLRKRLSRLVECGEAFRPSRGMYVRSTYWNGLTDEQKARHLMRTMTHEDETIVFSHASAALVHGLEVPKRLARRLHSTVVRGSASRSSGRVIRHTAGEVVSETVDGIRVTPVDLTTFDCLRSLDLPEGLAIADSVIRSRSNAEELEKFFMKRGNARGASHAIQTLGLADGRSENGGESIARGTMLELGCVPPDLQRELRDPISGKVYRVDFFWDVEGAPSIAGELDGKDKYLNPKMTKGKDVNEVLLDERLRESRISVLGIKVMRFRFAELSNRTRFAKLLDAYGVPRGCPPPRRYSHPSMNDGMTSRRWRVR